MATYGATLPEGFSAAPLQEKGAYGATLPEGFSLEQPSAPTNKVAELKAKFQRGELNESQTQAFQELQGRGFFAQEAEVPEWGQKSPALYGAYGAGKALLEQAVIPAVETIGAIAGSVGGPIVGTALGYGAAKKGMDIIEEAYGRLGGEEPKERTLKGELAGSAADVASAMVFGKGMDVAASAFRSAGPALKKVSTYMFDELPQRLYASSVKLPLSKKWIKELPRKEATKRTEAIEAGIKERILPTKLGLAKIKRLEREVRQQVDEATAILSTNPDLKIKVSEVLDDGLKKAYKTAKTSADPVGTKETIDKIKESFKAHGEYITPQNANAIKRTLYQEVNWGEAVDPITAQSKKGIAKKLMFKLEELYPELQALNEVDAARIGLTEGIEKAVGRVSNRNIVGLGTKVLATHPKAWPVAIWDATMGHPTVKARIAFALAKANPEKYSRFVYPELPAGYTPAKEIAETGVYRYAPEFKGVKATRPKPFQGELHPAEAPTTIRRKADVAKELEAAQKEEAKRLRELEKFFHEKPKSVGAPLRMPSTAQVRSKAPATVSQLLKGLNK